MGLQSIGIKRIGLHGPLNYGTASSSYWTQLWKTSVETLFISDKIDKLPDVCVDEFLYNEKIGATDYLIVNGTRGSYTFQCPNTAPYIAADTDYIWFKTGGTQRTTTEAELIGYDLQKTPVRYDDDSPNAIRAIMILSSAVTGTKRDRLFRDMRLSVLWDNDLNTYGHVKSNRIGQQLWTPEVSTLMTNVKHGYNFEEASGNAVDAVASTTGTSTNITYDQAGKINKAFGFTLASPSSVDLGAISDITGAFSVSLWAKRNNLTSYAALWAYALNYNGIVVQDTGNIFFSNSSVSALATWAAVWTDETAWHHLVFTFSGQGADKKVNFYFDNVSKGENTCVVGALDTLVIGSSKNKVAGHGFDGLIDMPFIWSKELTPAEVAELYNSGAGKPYPFLA